jgi:hypothetical protein
MLARNNRGIVTIRDVTRTAVAKEQLRKHVSVDMNPRNNRRAVFSMLPVPRGYIKDTSPVTRAAKAIFLACYMCEMYT